MKKVLIIAYYWPPAGGPGVQRWLKFVKYLPEFGIEPVVYVPENPTYPIVDKALLNEIPGSITVIKHKITEPYAVASLLSKRNMRKISSGIIPAPKKQSFIEKLAIWIRGNIFIPDARVLWVNPSVRYLKKYIAENGIETIVTTGPPHSLHLIGLKLQEQCKVKWFADFRDPWTTIGYHESLNLSASARKRHKSLEKEVLSSADHIIVTSQTTKNEFREITERPIDVITNGYDLPHAEKSVLDEKFSLAHIGSLLSGRNPLILWESLSELIQEIPDFKSHFQLKLIGTTSEDIIAVITEFDLLKYTEVTGYQSHEDAVLQQRKSQVLLLIEIDSEATKSIIPGKLFEYMVSARPILAIGPQGSDFAEIIAETNTGMFFNYGDKQKLKKAILDYYKLYLAGNLSAEAINTEQFSRRNLTRRLAEILH